MKNKGLKKSKKISFNFAELAKLGVAQKIWGGFAVVLGMLAIVVAASIFKLTESETSVDTVINQYQPRTLTSLQLSTEIQEAASSLSFYLLSKDEVHKKNFEQSLLKVSGTLEQLKALAENNPELSQKVQDIETKISKFIGYDKTLLPLATSDVDNFPALKFAAPQFGPVGTCNSSQTHPRSGNRDNRPIPSPTPSPTCQSNGRPHWRGASSERPTSKQTRSGQCRPVQPNR